MSLLASITIFVLAIFVGFEVISKVPAILHTPLMSGTNAIHGIVLVGAMLVPGISRLDLAQMLGFIAVVFGTVNVVGGFLVTDRMLQCSSGDDDHLAMSGRRSTSPISSRRSSSSRDSQPTLRARPAPVT